MPFKIGLGMALAALFFAAALASGEAPQAAGSAAQEFESAAGFYQRGQYSQARTILARLLAGHPGNPDVNELLGLVCAAENDRAHADEYLRKAAELAPSTYDNNHNYGEFLIGEGKLAAAVPYLARAQTDDPSSVNNGYDLALAQIKTGQYAPAKAILEALLRRSNSADLHSLLGAADEHAGAYIQAANEYQTAAHMDPSEANIFAWGSELLLHHTLEAAIQVFARGAQLYPRSARMQVGYGIALYSRGHYQGAIDAFCAAIDINPKDPRPYTFLGKIYDVSPLQAAAVTGRFARFARLQPRNAQALYYYAMSLWKASRGENSAANNPQVQKLLETSVALDPAFADAHLQLGILYAGQRQWAPAVRQYHDALRADPNLPDAHYRLGEALVRTGDRAAAQSEFQIFNRLHQRQVKQDALERSEITQFVYTSGAPEQAGR